MAKITMMPGIASISGRVGNCCFRTMKKSGKVYMHQVVSKEKKGFVKVPSDGQDGDADASKRIQEKQKATMENCDGGL